MAVIYNTQLSFPDYYSKKNRRIFFDKNHALLSVKYECKEVNNAIECDSF